MSKRAEPIITAQTDQTALDFLLEQGRLPKLGDPVPPWRYRGWLLPYIQMAEEGLAVDYQRIRAHASERGVGVVGAPPGLSRWNYYLDMHERSGLSNEPIPEIDFTDSGRHTSAGLKLGWEQVKIVEHERGGWGTFADWLRWLGYGCGFSHEASRLSDETQEQLYRGFDASVWLRQPYDYLGTMMSERKSGSRWNNPTAFFPTPHEVCELMARMTFGGGDAGGTDDQRAMTVCDPCVGSGRLLLHASNRSLRLYGCDIDPLCVLMTHINGAFYAPWLAFGAPEAWFDSPAPAPAALIEAGHERHGADAELVFVNGQGLLFGALEPEQSSDRPRKKTKPKAKRGKS